MKPFERNVSSRYGSPMGRASDKVEDFEGKCHLQKVPMFDYDYDKGGAYWGSADIRNGVGHIYCAWDNEGHVAYVRALGRTSAKNKLEGLKFYC